MIGPTAGMVINRSTRSTSNEPLSSERTRALSVFCRRTTVSRHSCNSGFKWDRAPIEMLSSKRFGADTPTLPIVTIRGGHYLITYGLTVVGIDRDGASTVLPSNIASVSSETAAAGVVSCILYEPPEAIVTGIQNAF